MLTQFEISVILNLFYHKTLLKANFAKFIHQTKKESNRRSLLVDPLFDAQRFILFL